MKTLILILAMGLSVHASAESLYRCEFTSERENREPFVMTGHIIASNKEDTTYLTLQPPISTDLAFDARVLITAGEGEGFNPMTLHPRGNTATTVAHGELHGASGQISYVDEKGSKFVLSCSKIHLGL